ncbi:hypothetical protein SAMN05216343_12143 [Oscillibacter sp. PC13]|nr:hypothetical protein SAMN05216343_12143 [Oscillibacter sp. PC13]
MFIPYSRITKALLQKTVLSDLVLAGQGYIKKKSLPYGTLTVQYQKPFFTTVLF